MSFFHEFLSPRDGQESRREDLVLSQSTCTCCFLLLTQPAPGPPANVLPCQPGTTGWVPPFFCFSRGIRHTIHPGYCEREGTQLLNNPWPGGQASWIVLSRPTGPVLQEVLAVFWWGLQSNTHPSCSGPWLLWTHPLLLTSPSLFLFLEASDTFLPRVPVLLTFAPLPGGLFYLLESGGGNSLPPSGLCSVRPSLSICPTNAGLVVPHPARAQHPPDNTKSHFVKLSPLPIPLRFWLGCGGGGLRYFIGIALNMNLDRISHFTIV